MNPGATRNNKVHPDPGPPECMIEPNVSGSPALDDSAPSPPAPPMTAGSAIAKPPSITKSCSVLTQADPSNPPAAKYAVMIAPPASDPAQRGIPVMTLRIVAPASSCAARIDSDPSQMSEVTTPRTVEP